MTAALITIVTPSRGRPQILTDMWDSALHLSAQPGLLRLALYLDQDDPALFQYEDRLDWHQSGGPISTRIGPRRLLSETWNLAIVHSPAGGIFMHGNDDVLFRTQDWDDKIRAGFDTWPDRIGCVHGRDGIHDGNQATLGFYSQEWIDVLGYFVPPYFSSDFNDTWLSSIADRVGRRLFLPDVYTEHMHPAVGKAPIDQTHRDRLDRHRQDEVDQLYIRLEPRRDEDADKLRTVIRDRAAEAAAQLETT